MKIYLCRHGQTTGDIENRYGGDYDDHLTDLGKIQAKELAKKLLNKGINKIYASPKIRAQETAQIISGILNIIPEMVDNLRERNQNGILTGKKRSYCKKNYPELVEKLKDYRNTIEGAESYYSFSERVLLALAKISKENKGTITIITHGGPIRVILRNISRSLDYIIEDCAIALLEVNDNKFKIISLDGIVATE